MSRIQSLKNERNNQIREFYEKQAAKKIGNKQLYRHQAILVMASAKFFLAERTIEDILSEDNETSSEPVDPNQIDMFQVIKEEEIKNSNNHKKQKNDNTKN